jgi:predicted Zn-dependent protease
MKLPPQLPILCLLISGLAGLACADIASPSRADRYEWRVPPGTTDTLSFHWPSSRLPVKIWAEDALNLPAHVQAGINRWKGAFLYGEFDAVVVQDSNTADVVVQTGGPAKARAGVIRLGAMAPECEGRTDLDVPSGGSVLQPPIRVFVNPRLDPAAPGVDECVALTTTHELGHAIGIFSHSPSAGDIMFGDPIVTELSPRDRATVEAAYHLPPNLSVGVR